MWRAPFLAPASSSVLAPSITALSVGLANVIASMASDDQVASSNQSFPQKSSWSQTSYHHPHDDPLRRSFEPSIRPPAFLFTLKRRLHFIRANALITSVTGRTQLHTRTKKRGDRWHSVYLLSSRYFISSLASTDELHSTPVPHPQQPPSFVHRNPIRSIKLNSCLIPPSQRTPALASTHQPQPCKATPTT